ncbi:MAG TPA: type II toxin-antitoxin system PemK/MazF family toxin [Thermomicrobiaceae bacterium]|nr:type II toxin-antitoxin system PemK/MazF family toxin [Thermomicrobiaceae bacterium]
MAGKPSRGEVWRVDLEPVRGHEQGRVRPCVIVSDDVYNHGPSEMVAIVPITSKAKGIPLHVAVDPPEGGLTTRSYIKCDDVRTIAVERLSKQFGKLSDIVMREVDDRLRIFLSLA